MAHTQPGDLSLRPNPDDPEALVLMPAPVHIDPLTPSALHPYRVARATLRTPERPGVEPYTEIAPESAAVIDDLLADLPVAPAAAVGQGRTAVGACILWGVGTVSVVRTVVVPAGLTEEEMEDELMMIAYRFLIE
jgi:hypothetical protein